VRLHISRTQKEDLVGRVRREKTVEFVVHGMRGVGRLIFEEETFPRHAVYHGESTDEEGGGLYRRRRHMDADGYHVIRLNSPRGGDVFAEKSPRRENALQHAVLLLAVALPLFIDHHSGRRIHEFLHILFQQKIAKSRHDNGTRLVSFPEMPAFSGDGQIADLREQFYSVSWVRLLIIFATTPTIRHGNTIDFIKGTDLVEKHASREFMRILMQELKIF